MISLFWGAALGWAISKLGDFLVFYGKWKVQERDYNKKHQKCIQELRKKREHELKEAQREYIRLSKDNNQPWTYTRGSRPNSFIFSYNGEKNITFASLWASPKNKEMFLESFSAPIRKGWSSGPIDINILGTDISTFRINWQSGSEYPNATEIPVDPSDSWIQDMGTYLSSPQGTDDLSSLMSAHEKLNANPLQPPAKPKFFHLCASIFRK